jgi:hypothetical protein
MNEIESKKNNFLEKYNYDRSKKVAISKAISAASQHNLLYSKKASIKERKIIREYWGTCLEEIGDEFRKEINLNEYELVVEKFKENMNNKFGKLFDNGSKHGAMFRISHSQKSISVYIKHLWCMDVIPEPKICPVDRIILSKTDAKFKKDINWGQVNSIKEHIRKFKYIQDQAVSENLTVAKWELLKFKN